MSPKLSELAIRGGAAVLGRGDSADADAPLAPGVAMFKLGEVANITRLSLRNVSELARRGRIRSVRIGRCVRVPREELLRLLREGAQ